MICAELPVYKKMQELVSCMDKCIVNCRKEVRYSYGEDLRHTGIELIGEISLANYCIGSASRRAFHLENCLGLYEKYKFCKRAIQDLGEIPSKQLAKIDTLLAQVGEQLMGWYKKYESSINGSAERNAEVVMASTSYSQNVNGGLPACK